MGQQDETEESIKDESEEIKDAERSWRSEVSQSLSPKVVEGYVAPALQVQYRCGAAGLPKQEQNRACTYSQMIKKGLQGWIFNSTQPSSEGTGVNSGDSSSLLFQNIKPEASFVMARTRRLTQAGRNV